MYVVNRMYIYAFIGAILGINLTDIDEIHSQRENLSLSSLEQTMNYVCVCVCVCIILCTCMHACLHVYIVK